MAQNYTWPSVSVTASNPSVGTNGQSPSATSSTLVAGQDPAGAQQPLQTDSSGNLLVALVPSPPSTQDVNLTEVGGAAVSLGQKAMAASLPVAIASDQSTLPISAASLPLPAGAATEATLATRASETTVSTISANIASRLTGSLVPTAYDEIQLTYTGANLTQAVYKLATVTVKTLTLTYTGSQLDSVVAS